jgi:DNA-binding response OmpR family regulator
MLRVLMVLEDYGELMFLQTVLKKMGFDVDAIQKPRALSDNIISMNPDVLVMTANGKRVKGIELLHQVRRTRGIPRIVLLHAAGQAPDPAVEAEAWLESPVSATSLLNTLAAVAGLDAQQLADKFQKLHMQDIESEKLRVLKTNDADNPSLAASAANSGNFGQISESTLSANERRERYKQFLGESPPAESGFANRQVADHVRALRQQENSVDRSDLEAERRAFVEHLFRKK